MRVIVLLRVQIFHRPIAGDGQAAGSDDRVKIRPRNVAIKILGEQFAIDLDPQAVGQLLNPHTRSGGSRQGLESEAEQNSQSKANAGKRPARRDHAVKIMANGIQGQPGSCCSMKRKTRERTGKRQNTRAVNCNGLSGPTELRWRSPALPPAGPLLLEASLCAGKRPQFPASLLYGRAP